MVEVCDTVEGEVVRIPPSPQVDVGEVLCNLPGGDAGEEANDAHNGHSSLLRRQRR
jgi:hypothetical protein